MNSISEENTQILPLWLSQFTTIYQKLGTENLHLLNDVYADNVEFIDPMHHIIGLDNLHQYFSTLYTHLVSCRFKIEDVFVQDNTAAVYWTMEYRHPKLNKGHTVTVEGHTKLKGEGSKVTFHRDYVDLGAMLYEHVPLLGAVVKLIKSRAKS